MVFVLRRLIEKYIFGHTQGLGQLRGYRFSIPPQLIYFFSGAGATAGAGAVAAAGTAAGATAGATAAFL